MFDFASFEEEVLLEADCRQLEVLDALLDRLLAEPPLVGVPCSYGQYLVKYVDMKLWFQRMLRDHNYAETDTGEWKNVHGPLVGQVETKMHSFHQRLYTNVCFECELCQTRRKPWPMHLRSRAC